MKDIKIQNIDLTYNKSSLEDIPLDSHTGDRMYDSPGEEYDEFIMGEVVNEIINNKTLGSIINMRESDICFNFDGKKTKVGHTNKVYAKKYLGADIDNSGKTLLTESALKNQLDAIANEKGVTLDYIKQYICDDNNNSEYDRQDYLTLQIGFNLIDGQTFTLPAGKYTLYNKINNGGNNVKDSIFTDTVGNYYVNIENDTAINWSQSWYFKSSEKINTNAPFIIPNETGVGDTNSSYYYIDKFEEPTGEFRDNVNIFIWYPSGSSGKVKLNILNNDNLIIKSDHQYSNNNSIEWQPNGNVYCKSKFAIFDWYFNIFSNNYYKLLYNNIPLPDNTYIPDNCTLDLHEYYTDHQTLIPVLDTIESFGKICITEIILPDNILTLHSNGFYSGFQYFYYLKKISGKNVHTISDYAFQDLLYLEEVDFPKLYNLGHSAFKNCRNLQKITLDYISIIKRDTFNNCGIKELHAQNVLSIDTGAFNYCDIEKLYLPSVEVINAIAFDMCSYLNYIYMPNLRICYGIPFSDCYKPDRYYEINIYLGTIENQYNIKSILDRLIVRQYSIYNNDMKQYEYTELPINLYVPEDTRSFWQTYLDEFEQTNYISTSHVSINP